MSSGKAAIAQCVQLFFINADSTAISVSMCSTKSDRESDDNLETSA